MDDLFLLRPVRINYDGFGVFDEDENKENGVVMSRNGSNWMVLWDSGWEMEVDSSELIQMMTMHEYNRKDPTFLQALTDASFNESLTRDAEAASTPASTNTRDTGALNIWRDMPSDDMDADAAHESMESEVEIMQASESTIESPEPFRLCRSRKICGDTAAFLLQWRDDNPNYTKLDLEKMCEENNFQHTVRQIRKWYGNQKRRVRNHPTPAQRKKYEDTRKKNMTVEQKETRAKNARRLRANMSPEQREREVLRDRKRRQARKEKNMNMHFQTVQEMVLVPSVGS